MGITRFFYKLLLFYKLPLIQFNPALIFPISTSCSGCEYLTHNKSNATSNASSILELHDLLLRTEELCQLAKQWKARNKELARSGELLACKRLIRALWAEGCLKLEPKPTLVINKEPDILRSLCRYAKSDKPQQPYERNDDEWGYYRYTIKEQRQARKFLSKIVDGYAVVKRSEWLGDEDEYEDAYRRQKEKEKYNKKMFPEVTTDNPDPQGGPDSLVSHAQHIMIKNVVKRDLNLVQRVLDQVLHMRSLLVLPQYNPEQDPGHFIANFKLITDLCRKWAFKRGPSSSVISALKEMTELEKKAYELVLEDAKEKKEKEGKDMTELDIHVATKVRYTQLKQDMTPAEMAAELKAEAESYAKAEEKALLIVGNLEEGGQIFRSYNLELLTRDILQRILEVSYYPQFRTREGATVSMFTFADFKKLIDAALGLANEIVQRSDEDVVRLNDDERNALQLGINSRRVKLRKRMAELQRVLQEQS